MRTRIAIIVFLVILTIFSVAFLSKFDISLMTKTGNIKDNPNTGNCTLNETYGPHLNITGQTSVDDEDTGNATGIENDDYLASIKLAGEWFLNNQDDSFLYYQYYPFRKEYSASHHSLREMGALWSITQLSRFLGDPRYNELAERGFSHFEEHFAYDSANDFHFVNITPTKIKLGYSAFTILILLDIDHPLKEYYLDKFARSIIFMQNDDGSLRTFFYSSRSTGVDYYPGEALLALMALYEYSENPIYLKVVSRAFPYYRDYWRRNRNTAFVPWQTRAYYKLYQAKGEREVADFILEMNDYMVDEYNPEGNCSNFEFSSSVVAVHVEGVIKAYRLALQLGDGERAECYARFVREGCDFTLTLQVTETGDSLELEAVGGILGSQTSESMRVDRNQHAVMALMDAYESGILG